MKSRIWAFIVALVVTFVFASLTHAQDQAQKYGVTFPIAQLGNCASLAECRTFCEDPVNQSSCIDFAKKKGFYQEDKLSEKEQELLEAAKEELGCDSKSSCQTFCHKEENFEKCSNFAQKYNLSGGHKEDPSKKEILEKAKQFLGCDSYQSCKSFCQDEANREKCSEFAKEVGLRGGEHHVGPGGCNSEQTCRAFCSDPANYQVCSGFSSSQGGKFQGPGGCDSEQSCRAYCITHEDECRSLGGPDSSTPPYNPQEMCSKTPNCQWTGDTCQCGSYDPSVECTKYPGCSWNGSSCQCTGTTQNYPQPSYDPSSNIQSSPPSPEPSVNQGGETIYKSECINAGCSWTDNPASCQCPSTKEVQGASKSRGLLYILWDFLSQ